MVTLNFYTVFKPFNPQMNILKTVCLINAFLDVIVLVVTDLTQTVKSVSTKTSASKDREFAEMEPGNICCFKNVFHFY